VTEPDSPQVEAPVFIPGRWEMSIEADGYVTTNDDEPAPVEQDNNEEQK
jgi:hypothetical protein